MSECSPVRGSMLLAASNQPRMGLRRVASFNSSTDKPLPSVHSRFGLDHIQHFVASPPPSPGLPTLLPRRGSIRPYRLSRRWRLLLALAMLAGMFYGLRVSSRSSLTAFGSGGQPGQQYEMVVEDSLPRFPTPLVVMDQHGLPSWTIFIPSSADFPLSPEVYADICSATQEVSAHVADLRRSKGKALGRKSRSLDGFVDVAEAVERGMLPGDMPKSTKPGRTGSIVGQEAAPGRTGSIVGQEAAPGRTGSIVGQDAATSKLPVCEKTMTFVMESDDAGLGRALMLLWTAYGVARKERRDFFIDDSRW
jgi:hypothetical protein